jgi:hypothetical protein
MKNNGNQFVALPLVLFLSLLSALPLLSQVSISSVSPLEGPVGSPVVITGTNFSQVASNNVVYFGSGRAIVTAASGTSLSVAVPVGASYQPISVTVNSLTATSAIPFNVTFASETITSSSFDPVLQMETGLYPYRVAIADFDGDGLPDAATANNANSPFSTFSVLRNTSTSAAVSFAPALEFKTGNSPYSLAAGDLNGDGKPDLVVTSIENTGVSVFTNTTTPANISFNVRQDYITGSSPYSVAIADIDSDGKPDIIIANFSSNTVSILKNTTVAGTLSFAPKVDLVTALGPVSLTVTDIDKDGKPDIASTNQFSNSISLFRNTSASGVISFAARADRFTASGPQGIANADLDADGKTDIVVACKFSNTVAIFKNTSVPGTISFAAFTEINGPYNPAAVSVADMNGDGKADLVVSGDDAIAICQNKSTAGSISFNGAVSITATTLNTTVADFSGDGKPDIAAPNASLSKLLLIRNRTGEPFIDSFSPASAAAGATISISGKNFIGATAVSFGGVAAASFNVVSATLITAVVASGVSGNVEVVTPSGRGVKHGFIFEGPPLLTGFSPVSATAGSTITLTGQNLYGATAVTVGGVPVTVIKVVSPGIVLVNIGAGTSGAIAITTPFGTSAKPGFVFTPPPVITSFSPRSGPVGTRVIIKGTNLSPGAANSVVFFGPVKGTVVSATSDSIAVIVPAGATIAPFTLTTANGKYTLAAPGPFTITFNGAGTLTNNSFKPSSPSPFNVVTSSNYPTAANQTVGDVDGDGKPDMALILGYFNGGYKIIIYKNTTTQKNIRFTNAATLTSAGSNSYDVSLADLDGDGKPDLSIGDNSSYYSIAKNATTTAGISFVPRLDYYVNEIPYNITSSDIDGDGKPDIILSKGNSGVFIYRNISTDSLAFGSEIMVTHTQNSGSKIAVQDMDGDGKPDLILSDDNNSVSIFKNQSNIGAIAFSAKISYPAGFYSEGMAIADLDGDGKADIAITERGGAIVSVYKNTGVAGTISFGSKMEIDTDAPGAFNIVAGDVNGDGKPDLAITYCCGYENVSVYKNMSTVGTMAFAPKVNYAGAGNLSIADVDVDGKPDLITVTDSIRVLRNQIGEALEVVLCPPVASANITSDATGTSYQWQMSTDSTTFVNIGNNANFASTNAATLQLINIPSSWYGRQFKCVTNSGTSSIFSITFSNTWTGSINNQWNNAGNWSCNAVPDANTDVLINSGAVVLNSSITIRSLTVQAGATVTVATGNILTVTH